MQTNALYGYDANGNQVSKVSYSLSDAPTGAPALSLDEAQAEVMLSRYDGFNRLKTTEVVKDGQRTTASYTYNAAGIRTSKTVDGVTTRHLLDGANVAADVTDGQVTGYIRGLSLIAVSQPDGELLRYVTDGHGDVRALMEQGGNVAKRYSYDAFGNESNTDGTDANPFRYCGEYFDKESGSVYLRNRYYSASVGRFTQEDPAKSGLNWYAYCGGNPVNFKDPSGLAEVMVKYAIEKNGGTATYYGDSNSSDVTLYGKTIKFDLNTGQVLDNGNVIGTFKVINGRCVVDSSVLVSAFNLENDSALLHYEGDAFNSADDAAMAFGLMYNPLSTTKTDEFPNGREYCANIYSDGDRYYFGNVTPGEAGSCYLPNSDKGRKRVAWVHTHGAYRSEDDWSSDYFSGQNSDGNGDGVVCRNTGCNGYVITPGGYFKRLDANVKSITSKSYLIDCEPGVTVLGSGMPY
ncbi:MAG: tRNA3(Ser)-specific nuclease WapA precursor [Firmicutes bacterium ADurb.Bin193]|nr:MAG: tRNA3(Ser)-specific nuclease WapA precursor [Firmicutes bacterium ADurb.Bin193]